jgi:hypothetical protein
MTHRHNPLFMDFVHRLISFSEARRFRSCLCFRLHARKAHNLVEPLGQRYFHSLGRKQGRLPQGRPSIQTMDEVREKKIRPVKNVSRLVAITSLCLAVLESSASQALRHSTTLLLRSVKVLSIIVSKSNYVQLQHPRANTTKRKYT